MNFLFKKNDPDRARLLAQRVEALRPSFPAKTIASVRHGTFSSEVSASLDALKARSVPIPCAECVRILPARVLAVALRGQSLLRLRGGEAAGALETTPLPITVTIDHARGCGGSMKPTPGCAARIAAQQPA